MTPWMIESGPASYHNSPSGEEIEIGYVWTISRGGQQRRLRVEVEPGAIYNDVVVASVLRNQLAEEDPPERLTILASGDLRFG